MWGSSWTNARVRISPDKAPDGSSRWQTPNSQKADRQVAERAQPLVEDLHVARTAHALERETLLGTQREHVRAEFFPVSALLPHRARQHLRGPHLGEPGLAHPPAQVVLDHAIERKAARVPEHHARPLLLLMEEVHPVGDGAMVASIHDVLRSLGPADGGPTKKAPSVAGGACGWSRDLARATIPRPAGAGRGRAMRGREPGRHGANG